MDVKKMFKPYEIQFNQYIIKFHKTRVSWELDLIEGQTKLASIDVYNRQGTVYYETRLKSKYHGKGYITILRGHLHERLKEHKMFLELHSLTLKTDDVLSKWGIEKTEEFAMGFIHEHFDEILDAQLREETRENVYLNFVCFEGGNTHEHQF